MIKRFIVGAALCVLPFSAFADDVRSQTKQTAASPSVPSWNGAYVGGSIGYTGTKVSHTDNKDGNSATAWFDANGATYGTDGRSASAFVNAGYNHQIGQVVIGAEADIGVLNARGTVIPVADSYIKSSITALGSVRGRIGYSFGPALLYATGGLAFANMSYTGFLDTYAPLSKNGWQIGWALGGGVEYALDSKWTLRGEGMYYNFGSQKDLWPDWPNYNLVTKTSVMTARLGLNYRF